MYGTQAASSRPNYRKTSLRKRLFSIAAAILAVLAILLTAGLWYMNYVPRDLDTATEKLSAGEAFLVSYEAGQNPVPINELHAWTVTVTSPNGSPVEDAQIHVDGDMPQHGHGLPTQPRVTEYLGDGRYLVEGVKFQMTGWWFLEFQISSESLGEDVVRFDFVLP